MGESRQRYKRKRTGRKYILAPPQPASPPLVAMLVMIGVVCGLQAVMTQHPVSWGIVGGAFLFVAGYLIAKSFIPVKRYRDEPNPTNKSEAVEPRVDKSE